jgi:hypothetical protein
MDLGAELIVINGLHIFVSGLDQQGRMLEFGQGIALHEKPAFALHQRGNKIGEAFAFQAQACAPSPTSAMSDVYKVREDDLRKCDEIFKPVPNHVGLLALIDSRPVGMDMVSLKSAYTKLHTKLVRRYTLEDLLDSTQRAPASDAIAAAEQRQFPSVGHGTDHRYKGKALAGTALVHENEVIHAAFFRLDEAEQPDRIASYRARRRRFTK